MVRPDPLRLPARLALLALLLAVGPFATAQEQEAAQVDVIVYGATPGGIAASLAAARSGHSVLLAEPSIRLGGMATNGLSHPDFRGFESLTGTFLELNRRVLDYYTEKYGPDSPQVKDSFRGTHAEPKVNLLIFRQMLAEHPKISVKTSWVLQDVKTRGPAGDRWIQAAIFIDPDGREHRYDGAVFIDGSYEGDLMAAAQVPYRIGREGQEEYGEWSAHPEGDTHLQGYNFRLVMTQDPANRVTVQAPPGYRREIFLDLLPLMASGRIKQAFGSYTDRDNVLKAQVPVLPNNKRDINDASGSPPVYLSMPGVQRGWPEGDAEVRRRIYDEHVLWNIGLIYFMQNDPDMPAAIREEARTWGLCRDEFEESGHLPPQIYVREGRRTVGLRIYTQHDTRYAPGDARAILHPDAIAMGDYGHSSHGARHIGPRIGGTRERWFEGPDSPPRGVAPYQIPYGTIATRGVRNLLVPVPVSASHVGFCALRLEPIWTSLGQAAGHAAHLALQAESAPDVRTMDVPALQQRLHADGLATIYVSDVLPGHPDFAAVQWWGTAGGLHGLAPPPARPGQRGPKIEGQHAEAAPGHAAELDRVLEDDLAARWRQLAQQHQIDPDRLPTANGRTTRGAWIRAVYQASRR